jgi:hypothetical protein
MLYGVIGPRDYKGQEYTNLDYIGSVLDSLPDCEGFISGGSKGVEQLVEQWTVLAAQPFAKIPPNIKLHGARGAFDIRNSEIIGKVDRMIIFWDGCSPGVIDTLAKCMLSGTPAILMPLE